MLVSILKKIMLYEAIQKSSLDSNVTNMREVPKDAPLLKFVQALKCECQLSRLANKVTRWFNETKADGKEFDYRFTGRDSRMFLHNFMLNLWNHMQILQGKRSNLMCLHLLFWN